VTIEIDVRRVQRGNAERGRLAYLYDIEYEWKL
jgi:hypothetical protein